MRRDTLVKGAVTKRQKAVSVMIGLLLLAVVYVLVALCVTPVQYDIAVGEVAPATITASRDVTDTVSTEAAIAEARDSVADVYSIDDTVTASVEDDISGFFDAAAVATENLQDIWIDKSYEVLEKSGKEDDYSREDLLEMYHPEGVDWEQILSDEQFEDVKVQLGQENAPDALVSAFAELSETDATDIKENVLSIATAALENGIREEGLAAAKDSAEAEIESLYSSEGLVYFAFAPIDQYLAANMYYDEEATEQAITAAAEAVEPVIYKQNQTVVVEGDVVTEAQMAVLEELGVVNGEDADFTLYIGMLLFIALLFGVYGTYMYQFEREVLAETRKTVMLAVIVVLIVAIAVPLARLDSRIIPVFFGTMLASVLVSQKSALALNVFLAFIVGAICSWNTGLFSTTMLRTVMMTVIGGSVAVFALYRPRHRASLIYAGLIAGGVNVVIVVLAGLVDTAEGAMDDILLSSVYALGSGLLAGVLAIGTLPIWEAVFRVSTPAKLLELSNLNHPLLKRLTLEAPGTYHHSILTANLAEAGADAVGANALLCRVGSYYHDVGKLKNPRFFKENQKGENPHDKMDPRESARIITEHLTHGLELAHKYKLPGDIQQIIVQHHGDDVVTYFYHKAIEEGIEPDESIFRYKGSKPSTKESAVVMLADCVEAAVRSMDDPDKEQARKMISKLIRDKYNDGQLDECPLGRRDLNILAKAFLNAFDGAFHERVKYPGQEQ